MVLLKFLNSYEVVKEERDILNGYVVGQVRKGYPERLCGGSRKKWIS